MTKRFKWYINGNHEDEHLINQHYDLIRYYILSKDFSDSLFINIIIKVFRVYSLFKEEIPNQKTKLEFFHDKISQQRTDDYKKKNLYGHLIGLDKNADMVHQLKWLSIETKEVEDPNRMFNDMQKSIE